MQMFEDDGIRLYRCDECGKWEEWGEGWRWRSATEYVNDILRVIVTCSDYCRNPPPKSETCAVGWCQEPPDTRGWCSSHYQRWLRHGTPTGGREYRRLRAPA